MGLIMHHPEAHTLAARQKALTVRPASQHIPVRIRRISALREGARVHKRGVCLGTGSDGEVIYLLPKHLRTHLHIVGPTGQGKSRLLLFLFQLLLSTNRPIVLIDPKGGLYRMARDWAMLNGFQKRLVLFDLSGDVLPGYNPLRQNGLRIDLQAQWVRESVRSAWGNTAFETTPLLARMLYLTLYVARALEVDLMEALNVLRPYPGLREQAMQRIDDPFVLGALRAYDDLSDRLKAEQSNSTVSRLEMFLCDQTVRQVICSPRSIDLEQLLADKKIILINFGKYQPLLPDAVKLLGRMFFNDLLAHIYKGHGEGRFDENHPCYVICDEIQNFATKQVCDALDEGRGIGCHMLIAHQHMQQLADEDQSAYLLHSVMNDARTKVIFGGLYSQDLQIFADNLLMQHFNPRAIKHIQRTPVFAPVESVRRVPTWNKSFAESRSVTESFSEADSVSHSVEHSVSRGRSIADSVAFTEGESEAYTQGRNSSSTESHNWGTSETLSGAHTTSTAVSHGRSRGRGSSNGTTDSYGNSAASGWSEGEGRHSATSTGEGQNMLPPRDGVLFDDPTVVGISTHTGVTEGQSSFSGASGLHGSSAGHASSRMQSSSEAEMDSTSVSEADTEGWSRGVQEGFGVAHQTGESEAWTHGTNRSTTRGTTVTNSESVADGYSDTVGKTFTRGESLTEGETITHGESYTLSPFYEYRREEIEAPTFLTPEEQKLLVMQKLARIPKMHFLVKAPESPDCVVRAPFVADPTITKRRLAAGLQSVYSALPCYTTLEQHDQGHDVDHGTDDGDVNDVIDVEVHEVNNTQRSRALPSPAVVDDDEPVFWQPPAGQRKGRQEKS
jgi:hypothetical protein